MFDFRGRDLTADIRAEAPGSFVELSAGVTHYELRGDPDGTCVVLIHGNAAPSVTWDHTIEDLCDAGLRVLRYDLFGHGFSDRPRLRRYDRQLYNTQLAELLSSLEIPDQLLHVTFELAASTRRRADRIGLMGMIEVVDVDPVVRHR